jgi:hypothetical protein
MRNYELLKKDSFRVAAAVATNCLCRVRLSIICFALRCCSSRELNARAFFKAEITKSPAAGYNIKREASRNMREGKHR